MDEVTCNGNLLKIRGPIILKHLFPYLELSRSYMEQLTLKHDHGDYITRTYPPNIEVLVH